MANEFDAHSAQAVIEALGMSPHPEGGWFVETWRAPVVDGARPAASTILYLLKAGERSHWHRVDAAEIWQWSAGGPLELAIATSNDGGVERHRLGGDVASGERPQIVVPADAWQAARPLGAWALVGCIVAPAFEYAGFELAPPDWEPGSYQGPGDERPTGTSSRSDRCSSARVPGRRRRSDPIGDPPRTGPGR